MAASTSLLTISLGITNIYLIRGESIVLVDGGDKGKFTSFCKALEKNSIDPKEINLIVLTHTHWDHTGHLAEIVKLTGAKILVHAEESERLSQDIAVTPPGITGWGWFLVKTLLKGRMPSEFTKYHADIVMEGEDYSLADWGIEGKIIHTPGHSPGSISVVLEDGAAFVGDMAMNIFPLRLSPGMPIFAECPEKITASWDRILSAGAKQIYPAHGKNFPIEKLKRDLPKIY